jgi:O-antigen/teichoic acid export membrane protein
VLAAVASSVVSLKLFPLSAWAGSLDGRVIWFLAVFVAAHLHAGTLQAVFYSQGSYAYGVLLNTGVQIAEFAAAWLALSLGGGFVEATFSYAIMACLGYLTLARIANTKFPWTGHRASFRGDIFRQLVRPALASLAFPLGNAMNHQGMRLIVGATVGSTAVATFVAIRMLTGLAVRLQDALGQVLEPEYARAHGAKDLRTTQQLVLRGSRATIWASIVMLSLLWFVGEPLFDRWTAGSIVFHPTTFALLMASALVNAIWFNVMKVAYATNRHASIAVTFLAGYTAACLAAAPLTSVAGISGAAIALLVAELAIAAYVIPKSLRMVEICSRIWALSVVKPPVNDVVLLVRGVLNRAAKGLGGRS